MSRKRKISDVPLGFEEVESNLQDDLFDVLYKTGNSSHFVKVLDMFNKPFQTKSLLSKLNNRIADLEETFTEATNFGFLNGFIHFEDVIIVSGVTKPSAMRKYQSLEESFRRVTKECLYHPGEQCNMVEQDVGFLLYLTWLDLPVDTGDQDESSTLESIAEPLIDVEDEEVAFQPNEEKELVEKFNTAMFRAETITKVEDEITPLLDEEDELNPLQCLPAFPTYCFNDREYLLLSDIQYLFELREDHRLALLARWGEFDHGFVDSSPCPLAVLDTDGENFIEKGEAALFCTNMFEQYEKQGLPSEEEFKALQVKLGIFDMGLEGINSVTDTSKLNETKSSINLYTDAVLEEDKIL